MKKLILTLLISLAIASNSFGQTITYEDFKEVIPFLQKEDYKGAYEKTSTLLTTKPDENSDFKGIVMYMNIYSATGMVILDQMTYEEFEKATKNFVGQNIVMSAHPCIEGDGYNSLQFIKDETGKVKGMTITSNSKNTNILCFEYFEYAEKVNPGDFIGKNVRCGGTLSEIEVNPNKSKIWVARLKITNAFARVMTPR